ncbi:MAG: VWA domain-containing protein [Bacteroidota bacterium]
MQRLSLFIFSLLILTSANGAAQPLLELRDATTRGLDVRLSFVASCDGAQQFGLRKQDFRLIEDGKEIRDFTLSCPAYVPISIALVLDASGSMAGNWNTAAKQSAHAFVDMMDGVVDEATITHFNETAATYQEMTTIKPMLRSAINALGSYGDRVALYDALYLNVVEVAFNSQNPGKALIVMTDSRNDSSYRNLNEVLELAKYHGIAIYMIGFGDAIDTTEMQMIADETGGRFFISPNAGQLAAIYQEISGSRMGYESECGVFYRTSCADGSDRQVVLEWQNLCGVMVSDTIHYTAPYYPSTLEPLHLSLTADTVLAGNNLAVELGIINPLEGTTRPSFIFTLQYDTTLLAFPRTSMWYDYLLDQHPIIITPASGGVRIYIGSPLMPSWTEADAPLLKLLFQARAPEGRGDTIPLTIAVRDAAFMDSCAQLQIDDAQAVIRAHGPNLLFTGEHPDSLFWNSSAGTWEPDEFDVTVRLVNTGDLDAENVSLRLDIDETKLRFVSPESGEQVLTGGTLAAGAMAPVVWRLQPLPGVIPPDSVVSNMTIYSTNHRTGPCACKMYFAEGVTGIGALPPAADALQLWPNPGNGRFDIALAGPDFEVAVLIVTDALGRTVLQQSKLPSGQSMTIDLAGQPAGLYNILLLRAGKLRHGRYLLRK